MRVEDMRFSLVAGWAHQIGGVYAGQKPSLEAMHRRVFCGFRTTAAWCDVQRPAGMSETETVAERSCARQNSGREPGMEMQAAKLEWLHPVA